MPTPPPVEGDGGRHGLGVERLLLLRRRMRRFLMIGAVVVLVLAGLFVLVQYPNYKRAKDEYARKYGGTKGATTER